MIDHKLNIYSQTIKTTDSYLTPFADDNSAMAPPDPFPNSEVKHRSANGSVVRPCESRSSSALYSEISPDISLSGVFLCVQFGDGARCWMLRSTAANLIQ